jgi:alkylhydroperoxidase/carboxymuconolactone decarboxylase family protein YurZ
VTTVPQPTQRALAGVAAGRAEALDSPELRDARLGGAGLDGRTKALVKLAALIALDAPPASYARLVADAVETGATPEDILAVLREVGAQVGAPRVVAAAPEIMLALGLPLPAVEKGR